MHSDSWHARRKLGVGGSDIASIAGLSRYGSAMSVYLEKIGADEGDEENEAMEWGNRLEATIADKFADEHPEFTARKEMEAGEEVTFTHPEHEWAFAHPDRLLFAGGAVVALWECKTVGREARNHNWSDGGGGDIVPDYVIAQIQWYLGVLGLPVAYLSVLFEGRFYREFVIERDDEMIALLLKVGEEFWRHVIDRTPPAIDASDATKEVLAILYRETVDEEVEVDNDLLFRRIEAYEAMVQAKSILQGIENQIKAALGEHQTGRSSEYVATWKPQTRAAHTVAESTFRVLRVREAD